MNRSILFLVAAVAFLIAALSYFLFVEDNSVVFGSAFGVLAIANISLFVQSRKKKD